MKRVDSFDNRKAEVHKNPYKKSVFFNPEQTIKPTKKLKWKGRRSNYIWIKQINEDLALPWHTSIWRVLGD